MKTSHRALVGLLVVSAAALAQEAPPQQPVPEDARDRVFYSEETERFKPLIGKLAHNVLLDQKEIWTSPFHMHARDAGWWLLFGAGTGALIATDRRTSKALPNTVDQVSISRHVSNLGATYTVLPITAGFYIGGALSGNPKARETVVEALKLVSQRPRPLEKNGKGSFFTGGDSFPSGHAAESWALAAVVAHEYNKNPLVPITAYGLASLVSFSRLSGRKHFASDVVAGSAMGWFIGHYVFKTHVDHSIHHRPASKLSGFLSPQVSPDFSPGSRSYGMALSWSR